MRKPTINQAQLIAYFDGGQPPTRRTTKATYELCEQQGWIERTDAYPFHRTTEAGRQVLAGAELDSRDVRANATNRKGRYIPTSEYVGFARRALRALVRRVGGQADVDGFTAMLELRAQLDEALGDTARALNEAGYSWADIAARAGMKRQSAWERWGRH